MNTPIVGLLSLGLALVASSAAEPPKDLWDMTAYRKIPLNLQKVASEKVPFQSSLQTQDWVRAGDSWVKGETKASTNSHDASVKVVATDPLIVEQYYFDCGVSPEGPNRIFFSFARPETATGKLPVLIVLHGGGGHGSKYLAIAMARNYPGCAAVALDYNGQFMPGAKRATEWRTITKQMRDHKLNLIPDLRNTPDYHFVMAARRQLDVLDRFPMLDTSRVACAGISYGGTVAFDLAGVDDRVKCIVAFFSAGGFEGTASRQSQVLRWGDAENAALWLTTYDPIAHAPRTHAAVFFSLGADDEHFWLSGALRHYQALPGQKRLLVRPNCDHGAGGPQLPDQETAAAWVHHVLLGGETLPAVDETSFRADGNVYSWRATGPQPITHAALCWSPGKAVSCARYWVSLPGRRDGEVWKAKIPERYAHVAAQVYATIWDARGCAVSSPVFEREGLDPEREAGPLWRGNAIWDAERGADAWRPLLGAKTTIESFAPRGVKLAPAGAERKFAAINNSIILASGQAAKHTGLRLSLNGNGTAGRLIVELVRDGNSLDEVKFAAMVDYEAGTSQITIPWSDFKSVPGAGGLLARPAAPGNKSLWPFNGLVLRGERVDNKPLTIANLTFAGGK